MRDPLDATYMFIVIGIGLSAGIGIGQVAILASVAFNAVVLGIWRMNYGAKPVALSGFRLVRPAKSLPGVSGAQDGKVPKPYNGKLTVHTGRSRRHSRPLLRSWRPMPSGGDRCGIVQQEDGTAIIEFHVRLKKTARSGRLHQQSSKKSTEGHTVKVELEL